MEITVFKYCFYIILAITLSVYYTTGLLRDKIKEYVDTISKYIEDNKVFETNFMKVAYNEFTSSYTIKNYMDNYNYLINKQAESNTSKLEDEMIERLNEDIKVLKVSFLSTVVIDNEDYFEDILKSDIKNFLEIIKKVQILNIFKFIFTILSVIMFIIIVF